VNARTHTALKPETKRGNNELYMLHPSLLKKRMHLNVTKLVQKTVHNTTNVKQLFSHVNKENLCAKLHEDGD